MQLSPNVFWIKGKASNFFLCVDDDGLALVDTGNPSEAKRVWQTIAQLGHRPADLKHIFITHADLDHAGSAAAIQAETNATIYAGAATAELLRKGHSPEHMPRLIHWFVNTFLKYEAVPAAVIETVADGDTVPVLGELKVLATPGHTPDHHSFYCPAQGILFAGDALNTRNGRLQRTPSRITADEEAATRSAIRLLELTPSLIACGHGEPMTGHSAGNLMDLFHELRQSH